MVNNCKEEKRHGETYAVVRSHRSVEDICVKDECTVKTKSSGTTTYLCVHGVKLTSPSMADIAVPRTQMHHLTTMFLSLIDYIYKDSPVRLYVHLKKKKIYLCVFACPMCVGSLGGQKKVLELELQDVVSIPV